jgi:hypothetical protein
MNRRELLKAGAAGAVGTLWPHRTAAAADTSDAEHTANASNLEDAADTTGLLPPPRGMIEFRLIISGSFVVVFPANGSAAEVSFLHAYDQEPDCKIPYHPPLLRRSRGTSDDGLNSWSVAGIEIEPNLSKAAAFSGVDWNVAAKSGNYPTPQTGWQSLKWIPMMPGKYDAKRLGNRRASFATLKGGTLQGWVPFFTDVQSTMWKLEDNQGNQGTPWKQAITDRIALLATIPEVDAQGQPVKIEIQRRIMGNNLAIPSLFFTPDQRVVELVFENSVSATTSNYTPGDPIQHFCGAYQVVETPLPVGKRFLPRDSGETFPAVANPMPITPPAKAKAIRKMVKGLHGHPMPFPLCDGFRLIQS